jgi:putative transposase
MWVEAGSVVDAMRSLVDPECGQLTISRQCELLGLARSSYYHELVPETDLNLSLMDLIDRQYMETPFYGSRRMTWFLNQSGHSINRKRVTRLMRLLDLEAIYPKPKLSVGDPEHRKYPYLLRGLQVDRPDQVWSSDITYVPLSRGYMYLVAVMDWHSRYVLSWRLSNSLETSFCVEALDEALSRGQPEIFNTDQGVQFTSRRFQERLQRDSVQISMDGKGRALDNVFIERLWRTVKYEHIYPYGYETVQALQTGLCKYLKFYNTERPHQGMEYCTPESVYTGEETVAGAAPRG